MSLPDVVYVVRPGDYNPELRYSLRSIAENLAHRRVFTAGHTPPWVANTTAVPRSQGRNVYTNSTTNLRAALDHPDLGEWFYLFNDDFYAMRRGAVPPVAHRGPVRTMRHATPDYLDLICRTADYLEQHGVTEPLAYELHLPMLVERDRMKDYLDALPADLAVGVAKRTLYGNLAGIGGHEMHDVRPAHGYWEWDWISTTDHSFRVGNVGAYVRHRFPSPGPYESPVGAPRETTAAWVSTTSGRVAEADVGSSKAMRLADSPDWLPVATPWGMPG